MATAVYTQSAPKTRSKILATTHKSHALSGQVRNEAGGWSWDVSQWDMVDRFLILGTEAGTYYVSAQKLTADAIRTILPLVTTETRQVVNRIVEISEAGRAAKSDAALFLLATCVAHGTVDGQKYALDNLARVARTGTHLYQFLTYLDAQRGLMARSIRTAVSRWFNGKSLDTLAYYAMKYQQRDGMSMGDVIKMAHVKPASDAHSFVYRNIVKGWSADELPYSATDWGKRLIAWRTALAPELSGEDVAQMVRQFKLPHEALSSEAKMHKEVWAALLEDMPAGALVRNLSTGSRLGLFDNTTPSSSSVVCAKLKNSEWMNKARLHPMQLLIAMRTYASGEGVRSTWNVNQDICYALDEAFHNAFAHIEPTGLRYCVALDISGSMGANHCTGAQILTARDASAGLVMSLLRTEPICDVYGFSHELITLPVHPRQRLDDTIRAISNLPFGGTDASLPIRKALMTRTIYDVFYIISDGDDWLGDMHVSQALYQYRREVNAKAKLVIVATQATRTTLVDPQDAGQLGVVGFDASVPQIVRDFVMR